MKLKNTERRIGIKNSFVNATLLTTGLAIVSCGGSQGDSPTKAPQTGNCTYTKIISDELRFIRSTGKYFIFSENDKMIGKGWISFSTITDPNTRIKIGGSDIGGTLYSSDTVFSSDQSLVFGKSPNKINLFNLDDKAGKTLEISWEIFGKVLLFGKSLAFVNTENNVGNIKYADNIETATSYTKIPIPMQYSRFTPIILAGFSANRYVLELSDSLNNKSYLSYAGGMWEKLDMPTGSASIKCPSFFNDRLVCLDGAPASVYIYDFRSKSMAKIPIETESSIQSVKISGDRLVVSTADKVTVTDLTGKKIFTSPDFNANKVVDTFLFNGILTYDIYPFTGSHDAVINCKIE